jgi:hypothetical protein
MHLNQPLGFGCLNSTVINMGKQYTMYIFFFDPPNLTSHDWWITPPPRLGAPLDREIFFEDEDKKK